MIKLLLCFALLIATGYCQLTILKVQDYVNSFQNAPTGLNYPEYIYIHNQATFVQLSFYNLTSQTITFESSSFSKGSFSTCQYAVYTVDYGYYTQFPFYKMSTDCNDQFNTKMSTIKAYRSYDSVIKIGSVQNKTNDELNCSPGPLKVQYYYSSNGDASTFVYRFCLRKNSTTRSLYKQYIADSSTAYIFTQDSIQKITGLTNISIVDMQPSIGTDGKFNVYLSQTNGVVVNGGSKYIQAIWKIPGNQKPLKIQKMCWSNNFAVLVDSYIYFISVSQNGTQPVINLIRKTQKININTSSCSFLSVGKFAICSIYDSQKNSTTWYVYGMDTNTIKSNFTWVWENKNTKPYISQDLCSTSSFFEGKQRYQFYYNNQINLLPEISKQSHSVRKTQLYANFGTPNNFIDVGYLFISYYADLNTTNKMLNIIGSAKDSYQSRIYYNLSAVVGKNTSIPQIYYEQATGNTRALVSFITNDKYLNNSAQTNIYRFRALNTNPFFSLINSVNFNVKLFNIGYLKNYDLGQYFLASKTSIQRNAFAKYSYVNSTPQIRYPYQFQADSYSICSVTTADNQLLFYRQDPTGLVVLRAGFRNRNFFALDNIKVFPQYSSFIVNCAHDGFLLANQSSKSFSFMNNDMQVKNLFSSQFSSFKFTKALILLKNGPFVQIRSLKNGDLLEINKWDLDDLITSIHSPGFINAKQKLYYQFTSNNNSAELKQKNLKTVLQNQ